MFASVHSSYLKVLMLAILFIETAAIMIIRGPQDQSVHVGGTVILRCTVNNKGSFIVYWFFDRVNRYLSSDVTFFEESADSRLSIVGDQTRGEFNLRISRVQLTDAGIYRCGYVPLGSNMLTSRWARLTVLQPPDEGFPRCEVSPRTGMIQLGQRATLTCTSQGGVPPASLVWLQNGFEITAAVQHRNVIERTFESSLNGVRFTCRATSPAFIGERTCSLTPLSINPTVRVEPPLLDVRPGETAVYVCLDRSVSPIVEISWTFGGIFVPPFEGPSRFELSMDRRTLSIRNVQLTDNHTSVQCTVATAQALSATAGALLTVRLRPTVEGPTDVITTLTPTTIFANTTLTPDVNQTEPLPTLQADGGLSTGAITGIIIGSIVIAQLLIIVLVFVSHKLCSGSSRRVRNKPRRGDSMVPSLAGWQGQQVVQTSYEGLDASGRSASAIRYLSLHPLRAPPTNFSTTDVGVYEAASDPNTNTIVYESGLIQSPSQSSATRDSMDIDHDVYRPALRPTAVSPVVYEQPRNSTNLTYPAPQEDDYYDPSEDTEQLASANKQIRSQVSKDGDYYQPPDVTEQLASGNEQICSKVSSKDGDYYQPPDVTEQLASANKQICSQVSKDGDYYEPPEFTEQIAASWKQDQNFKLQPNTNQSPLSGDESEVLYELPLANSTGVEKEQANITDDEVYYEPPLEEYRSSSPVMTHMADAHLYDVAPDDDVYETPDVPDVKRL
ncbi:uncharacterized protein LOC110990371 [Acanthaster planci]|uniref:Uncharacterized protein LOC110990371 n=1 Tax=Acanthaster planci TaxID=133434 RepID=A0A8B8A108_ACAPL|nr:uncharacterized protein LOC110990371 [Acanthaster planci]